MLCVSVVFVRERKKKKDVPKPCNTNSLFSVLEIATNLVDCFTAMLKFKSLSRAGLLVCYSLSSAIKFGHEISSPTQHVL